MIIIFLLKVTTQYENIINSIYAISWYEMPIEVQKKVPAMIAVAQKPILLRGLLSMECTHEFFQGVGNIASVNFGKK